MLLTGKATIALLAVVKEAQEEEAERVTKQKVEDRLARRVEKEKLAAEKKVARLVKKAERRKAEAAEGG